MRILAVLLPVIALAVVGLVALLAGALTSDREPAEAVPGEPSPAAEVTTPRAAVRDSSVCDGLLRVPDPGEERAFPAVYTQIREAEGIYVVGTPAVSAAAFKEAIATIEMMFEANDLDQALAAQGTYVVIAEPGQGVLDVAEFACLEKELGSEFFTHVCGVADRADYPVVTVNELDLLGDSRGPCGGGHVLIHELGHLVQSWGLGPTEYFEVRRLFQDAQNEGKYRNQYASTNANEYFAEGTQEYFTEGGSRGRAWLERYDPPLFALLESVYH